MKRAGRDRAPAVLRHLLEQLGGNERLRVQLLRFIDVLPMLTRDDHLIAHLQAYFTDQDLPIPALFSGAISHASSWPANHLVAASVRQSIEWIGSRFIAAEDADGLFSMIRRLNSEIWGQVLKVES